MHQQDMGLLLLKVEQSAFTQAFFSSLSGIHEYSGGPLNGPIFLWQEDSQLWITTRLVDEFGHGFSCFVWHVEVKMAPMVVISLFLVKT